MYCFSIKNTIRLLVDVPAGANVVRNHGLSVFDGPAGANFVRNHGLSFFR